MLEKLLQRGIINKEIIMSYEQINTILQEEDIEGFIEAGAPSDEYASEAEDIAMAIGSEHPTYEIILGLVSMVWKRNFNLSSSEMEQRLPNIQRAAERIRDNL